MERKRTTREQRSGSTRATVILIGGFLCALILSGVRINELHMPLPLGLLLGSQLAGFEPAAIVGGIILGSFSGEQPYWQGTAIAILYWGVTRIVLSVRKKCEPTTRMLIYLGCCIATLPISAINGLREVLYGAISIAVSVLFAYCCKCICTSIKTMNRTRLLTDTEQAAIVVGIGAILLSCTAVVLSEWSLTVSLLLILTAAAVSARGVYGAAAGIFWSVTVTLYRGGDPALIGSVALAALIGSAFQEKGRLFVVGAFFLSGILFQTYRATDAFLMSVPNLLCAMLIYLVLPKSWLNALRKRVDPHPMTERILSAAIKRTEHRASGELERMGKMLGGFSAMFHEADAEDDSVARWTVQGALAICRGCECRRLCWRDADAMRDTVLAIADETMRGNRVTPMDPIDETCRHFGDLCSSILLSYQQALNRNAVSLRAKEQSGFTERQLSGAGAALCAYARQMRARSRSARETEKRIRERLTRAGYDVESLDVYETGGSEMISVGIRRPLKTKHSAVRREIEIACGYPLRCVRVAQSERLVSFRLEQDAALHATAKVSKTSQNGMISGDATGECRFPGGRVCFVLSDGMGSGRTARRESESAIRLLFRLYHAGVDKELVYENVNRMLLAQNETEMYATLDAVSIDLNTGETELLKYGAPPSFLLRDGEVSTIAGEALPCGILAEAKPSVIRMKLQKNDCIVLCSDGVQDVLIEGTEQAIRALGDPSEKPGEKLLKLARSRGGTDDMTVMVIRVA